MEWWRDARFGMFIHWGLYAVPGGEWKGENVPGAAEWIMHTAKIPVADYDPLVKEFDPTAYDADAWVQLAKQAGMKYIVITTKHHEGFSLWPSKANDWNVTKTPYGKDLLDPLAEACRRHDIKLGFYYSILDWRDPLYGQRRAWDLRPEDPEPDMDAYTAKMKGQLKELLTEYGDIAILWFDGEWEDAWTHERGIDLYDYVKSLQPDVLVNNRVDKGRQGMQGMTRSGEFRGDFGTPEQEIPSTGLPGVDWESCMTMNRSWGWHKNDHDWKSADQLIENLFDTASKGGNYLLNVGPKPDGTIPEASIDRLESIGEWMKVNSQAIYGTGPGPFSRHPYRWTSKESVLYGLIPEADAGSLRLDGFLSKIDGVSLLSSEGVQEVEFSQDENGLDVRLADDLHNGVLRLAYSEPLKVEDPAVQPDELGLIHLEADRAELDGPSLRLEGEWLGFWTSADASAKWEFEVEHAGDYQISLEFACRLESAGSLASFRFGPERIVWRVAATEGWRDFKTAYLGTITLEAGRQVALVQPDGMLLKDALFNLKRLTLTPAPSNPSERSWPIGNPEECRATVARARRWAVTQRQNAALDAILARVLAIEGKHSEAEQIIAGLDVADPVIEAWSLLERGRFANSAGRPEEALPLFRQAAEAARPHDPHLTADALHMVAIASPSDQRISAQVAALAHCHTYSVDRWLPPILNNLGWDYADAGQHDKALPLFEEAQELRQMQANESARRMALYAVAHCHRKLGELERAKLMLTTEHLWLLPAHDGYIEEELAETMLELDQADEAKAHFRNAYSELSKDSWIVKNQQDRLDRLRKLGGA